MLAYVLPQHMTELFISEFTIIFTKLAERRCYVHYSERTPPMGANGVGRLDAQIDELGFQLIIRVRQVHTRIVFRWFTRPKATYRCP